MTNVLIINSTGHLGGAEKILSTFLNEADRDLFNFFAITPSEGRFAALLREKKINVAVVERLYKKDFVTRDDSFFSNPLLTIGSIANLFRFSNAVSQYMKNSSIDLVITNGAKACIAGGMAARGKRIKSIWIVQDILPDNLFTKIFHLCAGLYPTKIIAISNAIKNRFPKSMHEKIFVIYPFLDQGELAEIRRAESLRSELHIGDDEIVLGAVGKIVPSKGFDIFLKALSRIKINGLCPHLKAVIAGDSKLEVRDPGYIDGLKSLAKSLGLERDAIFADWRDDLYNILATIDILVHTPTRPEGFGRVLIEAMAASRPIVAFDQGAIREIIADGVSGLLIDLLDQEALTAKLEELIGDESKRKKLGEAGRRKIETYFVAAKHGGRFNEALKAIAQEGRRSSR